MYTNFGVIQPKVSPTDWQAQGESGITYKEVTSDWTPYLPVYEAQEMDRFASQACVTFSLLNIIESQIKQQTGKEVNLSDRFTAKMSNTTPQGNYLQVVLDSIRKDGWLLEADYPFPRNSTWNEYYKDIPQVLKDKAKKNLEESTWEIKYEWVNLGNCTPNLDYLKTQLKQAPLQIATSFASGNCVPEHAMVLYHIDTHLWIYDSYRNGVVRQPLTYALPWIMKVVVVPKTPTVVYNIPPITKDLRFGDISHEVRHLQQKLIKLGYLSKGLDTRYYGPLTRNAVSRFQWANKVASPIILWWNKGNLVAGLTRAKLNML